MMSQAGLAGSSGGGTILETLTGNSGGAVPPTGNNINTVGTGSITIVGNPGTSTLTTQLTGLTNHNVLVGAGTATITNVVPSTAGFVLTSNGAAADPSFQAVSASGAITTITGNSGGAESPTAGGNFNVLGTGSITVAGSANTETVQLTGLTNHAVLVGAGTATITNVGPSSTTGAVFIGSGSSADPAYSTTTSVSDAAGNLSVSSSQSGGTNGVIVTNSSNTASSNAYVSVSTAGTSAGNALVQLSNTADTVWSVWTPSTTNGSFHITPGNPGATDVMTASHSGNVDFPTSISLAGGTALSNYTEGTWTPTLIGGSTAGTTTYTAQNGYYTRIGNMVTVWAIIVTTGSTGTGNITFGGLPFTVKNQTNYFPPAVVFSNNAFTWPVGTTSLVVQGQLNSQTALLYGNGSTVAAAAAQISNVAYNFQYTLTYQV